MTDAITTLRERLDGMAGRATPGPWEWGENPAGEFSNEVVVRPEGEFPHGRWIADFGMYDTEPIANAAFVAALVSAWPRISLALAAAGRMAEALERCASCLGPHNAHAADQARAALASWKEE